MISLGVGQGPGELYLRGGVLPGLRKPVLDSAAIICVRDFTRSTGVKSDILLILSALIESDILLVLSRLLVESEFLLPLLSPSDPRDDLCLER